MFLSSVFSQSQLQLVPRGVARDHEINSLPLIKINFIAIINYYDYPEHVLTWEGYGNRRVSYPEHV